MDESITTGVILLFSGNSSANDITDGILGFSGLCVHKSNVSK